LQKIIIHYFSKTIESFDKHAKNQKIYEKSKSVGEGQTHFTERTLLGSREGLLGKKISSFSIDHC
jgi:hypothetical protein